jgi:ABC-2 type transport system ATP-binding protein
MVEVEGLVRRFGSVVAVQGATFSVPRGSIAGILGPNGAGKTSTLRMLAGALQPTGGAISIAGIDMRTRPREARRHVGYLPEHNPLHPELRVDEQLAYRGRLHGLHGRSLRRAIAEVAALCQLDGVRRRLVGVLSKGYRQRVGLAAALIARPALLILDEPTSGLDPSQLTEFRSLLRGLRAAHTILLSSHVLAEIDALCDRLVMIRAGRVVAAGTIEEIQRRTGSGRRIVVEVAGQVARLRQVLATVAPDRVQHAPAQTPRGRALVRSDPSAQSAPDGVARLEIDCADERDGPLREEIARACAREGLALRELSLREPSLEELFLALTGPLGGVQGAIVGDAVSLRAANREDAVLPPGMEEAR